MNRLSTLLLCVALSLGAEADVNNLLPLPRQMELADGSFALGRPVRLTDATDCLLLKQFLSENGCTMTTDAAASVTVELVSQIEGTKDYALAGFPAEGYELLVGADNIIIRALTPTGVTRAAATLLQMAEYTDGTMDGCRVVDWPAFKLRGYMHDVGRSFVTVDEIKHELDLMARFKVNCFHWHLTENQAWRFEVKAYPQLTSSSSMTRFAGQYYTQAECREVMEYAAARGIIIIPEIDMPGHSAAFERAMGFGMQTDKGMEVLKQILTEAAEVFSLSPYIHIGADEQNITYSGFLSTLTAHVHSLGKKVVTWNPIRNVTITSSTGADMTQMWSTAAKAVTGLPNIDCRYLYANHFDVFADLVGIYKSNVYYAQEGSMQVAGNIIAYWNDRKTSTQHDIICQNNLWATTLAMAERAWMGGGKQYIEQGGTVLPNEGEEYDEFVSFERRFLHHKHGVLTNEAIPYVKQTNVRWRLTDAMPNGGVVTTTLPPEKEGLKDSYTLGGREYGTRIVTGAGIYLRHTWGTTVPTVFADPQTGTTAYAWTYVYSPVEQQAGALIEFYNYGRSEVDLAPDAGTWDRKGSRIWLNDEELMPPTWTNTGKSITSEVDLGNENFTARPAYRITLHEGWNKVFVKLPNANASGVRLNKWMWTFVVTDTEGRDALEGIRYSPDKIMDDAAEALSLYISTVQAAINDHVSDRIGYYRRESAAQLQALIDEVKATLSEAMTGEEREAQRVLLETEYQQFLAHYREGGVNQPKASTDDKTVWYSLCTPLRGSYYATSAGANAGMTGKQTLDLTGYWKFVERGDGTFNLVNYDGSYVAPTAAYNSQVTTTATAPTAGWSILPSDAEGYVIIVSGGVQLNQTNLSAKIYNWGGGSNTSDTGCKYVIAEAPALPVSDIKVSTDAESYYYNMYTPGRSSLYATSYGDGATLVGVAAPSESSAWKFVKRTDGALDIVNYADDCYVSPAAAYNTALTTVGTQPSEGWTLTPVSGTSFFIITSASGTQWNQTTNAHNFNVFNWGGGINTSDTGCQYFVVEADVLPTSVVVPEAKGVGEEEFYTLAGMRAALPLRAGLYVSKRRKVVVRQ